MTPFFPLLYQILHTNCKFMHASREFWEISQFCGNFNIILAEFGLKLHFCTLNDPHFWESTPEKTFFFFFFFLCPHRMTPFFRRNLTPNAPNFRSPIGTYTSLSYSSAPIRPPDGYSNTFWLACTAHVKLGHTERFCYCCCCWMLLFFGLKTNFC